MKNQATELELYHIVQKIREVGLEEHISQAAGRVIVSVVGDDSQLAARCLEILPGVEQIMNLSDQHKIVSKLTNPQGTEVEIAGQLFGGKRIQIIAGPCSVENISQMQLAAQGVKKAGCRVMRGGAFKPRTSPYDFQGLGVEGLVLLKEAAKEYDLPIVTELMDVRLLDTFLDLGVDAIQIGARNMQNYDLLKEVGRINKPIILKRGLSATIHEWLLAAEYIAIGGNQNIIFCERGIRTFETAYRNVLDVTAIAVVKKETHLPVIADPSHAGGKAWMVPSLAQAAIAAGADGLMLEMHPKPDEALCDADQALTPEELCTLMDRLQRIALAIDRNL